MATRLRNDLRTLVLNASYEPHQVLRARRALNLVLYEKADPIRDYEFEWHSATSGLLLPSVIKLRRYVTVPRETIPLSRRTICLRDRHRCAYQTPDICTGVGDTMDHVIPQGQGGAHTWENIVAACRPCNQKKGNQTPEEAGMPLHFKGHRPLGANAKILMYGVEPPWEEFLFS